MPSMFWRHIFNFISLLWLFSDILRQTLSERSIAVATQFLFCIFFFLFKNWSAFFEGESGWEFLLAQQVWPPTGCILAVSNWPVGGESGHTAWSPGRNCTNIKKKANKLIKRAYRVFLPVFPSMHGHDYIFVVLYIRLLLASVFLLHIKLT